MNTPIEIPDIEFIKFPKISRLNRECTITEKIDGTNALIHIAEDGEIHTASRNRWIVPGDDNYGFSAWVQGNQEQIIDELGVGFHRGEWCGGKIQRGYGLTDKVFVIFESEKHEHLWSGSLVKTVPILWKGNFSTDSVEAALDTLRKHGSIFAPGFDRPEGIVITHNASRNMYKVTLENDDQPKGRRDKP